MAKRESRSVRKVVKKPPLGTTLQQAALRVIEQRAMASGTVAWPCLPSLLDRYLQDLTALWRKLGRSLSVDEAAGLRRMLAQALAQGFAHSPHSLLVVQYQIHPAPKVQVEYSVQLKLRSVEAYYQEWSSDGGAYFGASADAKVMALARSRRVGARVLDVGAGHGRNALPLARLGLSVDALELVDTLRDRLAAAAAGETLPLQVIAGDLLSSDLVLPRADYDLVVLSEVVSHLRDVDELRVAFVKLAAALSPDGLLVCNAFLADEGYTPDLVVREASQAALSSVFTRTELAGVIDRLELALVSDESACGYEQQHLPDDAWPPTGWFEAWAQGRNVVDLPEGEVPFELRWLVYRKIQPRG